MFNKSFKEIKEFTKGFTQGFTSGFSDFIDSIYYEVEEINKDKRAFFDFMKGFLFAALIVFLWWLTTVIFEV